MVSTFHSKATASLAAPLHLPAPTNLERTGCNFQLSVFSRVKGLGRRPCQSHFLHFILKGQAAQREPCILDNLAPAVSVSDLSLSPLS